MSRANEIPGYDDWKLQSDPRLDDDGAPPIPEPEYEPDDDDDDDDWFDSDIDTEIAEPDLGGDS